MFKKNTHIAVNFSELFEQVGLCHSALVSDLDLLNKGHCEMLSF